MTKLGGAIIEVLLSDYGNKEVLRRLSDPFWFQSFGAVLGMDWHSSGITTSVMGALKRSINARSQALGLHVCGGRGLHSRGTPSELMQIAHQKGLDGDKLIWESRLTAKIDNTAVQDGFQIYLHNFIVADSGEWAVVQQGMNPDAGYARRYHWHSPSIKSFVEDPHASIYGVNQGQILNMVDKKAESARLGVLALVAEKPSLVLKESMHLKMPAHHDVRAKDIDLKRLGAILYLAHDSDLPDFESLLLTKGLGPRTMQSLALVREVIYGSPIRFNDPARYSFAHGGKDGHPFPVPLEVYDETISFLNNLVGRTKIDQSDRKYAFRKLHEISQSLERDFKADSSRFDDVIQWERLQSAEYGGRTVADDRKVGEKRANRKPDQNHHQLKLW